MVPRGRGERGGECETRPCRAERVGRSENRVSHRYTLGASAQIRCLIYKYAYISTSMTPWAPLLGALSPTPEVAIQKYGSRTSLRCGSLVTVVIDYPIPLQHDMLYRSGSLRKYHWCIYLCQPTRALLRWRFSGLRAALGGSC